MHPYFFPILYRVILHFFPFLGNLNFSCYFFLHLCRYVLKCVVYNCHFGCDLKSVAYIQDELLIKKIVILGVPINETCYKTVCISTRNFTVFVIFVHTCFFLMSVCTLVLARSLLFS